MTTYSTPHNLPILESNDKIAATTDSLRQDINDLSTATSLALTAEGSRAEAAAKWKRGTIPAGTDIYSYEGAGKDGVYASLTVSNTATLLNLPPALAADPRAFVLTVRTLTNTVVLEIDVISVYGTTKYQANSSPTTGNGWTSWVRILNETDLGGVGGGTGTGLVVNEAPIMPSAFKNVALALTVPANASGTESVNDASLRFPLRYGAAINRWRLHVRNINDRSGTIYPGAISFTGAWFSQGSHSTGVGSGSPVKILNAFTTPSNGGEYTSPWISVSPIAALTDYHLVLGFTAANGQVNTLSTAPVWRTTSAANASLANPAGQTFSTNSPFSIWIEAEVPAATPVVAAAGASGPAGVGSTLPILESPISIYARNIGGLPMHYTHPGSDIELWLDETDYKWEKYLPYARPDALILDAASNSVYGSDLLSTIQTDFGTMADIASRLATENLYAMTVHPRDSTTDETKRRDFNTWIKTLPYGMRDVFDQSTAISADDETVRAEYYADGTHTNTAGAVAKAGTITRPITTGAGASHTHAAATTTVPGFLSAADKVRIDTVEYNGANIIPSNFGIPGGWAEDTANTPPGARVSYRSSSSRYLAGTSTTVIPIDETKTYRYSFDIHSDIAGQVTFIDANWKTKANAAITASPRFLSNYTIPTNAWTSITGYFGPGTAMIPPAGSAGISPFVYANHVNGAQGGNLTLSDFRIVDVTEVVDLVRGTSYLATSALSGAMSSSDKAKLDAATTAATAVTLMMRDGAGGSQLNQLFLYNQPTSTGHATRKDYVDAQVGTRLPRLGTRGVTKTIYVRATGNDANDGSSSALAFREIRAAVDSLAAMAPVFQGSIVIDVGAGTYKGGIQFPSTRHPSQDDYIKIKGPAVGHPNVPTVIIDKAADTTATYGILGENGVYLWVEDIKILGAFSNGLDMRRGSAIQRRNVHVDGAGVGVSLNSGCFDYAYGGITSNSTQSGVAEMFNIVRSYDAAGSVAAGHIIRNCPVGLDSKAGGQGHLDYLTVEDCPIGVQLDRSSANVGNLTLKRNQIGLALKDAEIHSEGAVIWGTGADANVRRLISQGPASSESGLWGWSNGPLGLRTGLRPAICIGNDYADVVHTGTVTRTNVYTFATILPMDRFTIKGKILKVLLTGSCTSAVTTATTLHLTIAGSSIATVTLPAGMASGTHFQVEWEMVCSADGNNQKTTGKLIAGTVAQPLSYTATTLDLTTLDRSVFVGVQLGTSTDTVTLRKCEVLG